MTDSSAADRAACSALRDAILAKCSDADTTCTVVIQALMESLMAAISWSIATGASEETLDAVIETMRDIDDRLASGGRARVLM
jgi:hypothetical protein